MSGYYKSKEVYIQYRDSGGNPHVKAVDGLYVGGHYTPPYYIDHNITITEITSTKCNAVEYTNASRDLEPERILDITGYSSMGIEVTEYSKQETEFTENIIQLSSYSSTPIDITFYTTNESDMTENILKLSSYSSTGIEYTGYNITQTQFGHDHCVTVTEVTSTPLVIQ